MKKDDLDIGALLLDTGGGEEAGEEAGGGEESAEVDSGEMEREAMSTFRDALKGDDLDAQVSAFKTLMEACGLSATSYPEEE